MEIRFKFRDNEKQIMLNLERNSLLYGLNGVGKTRILETLKEFSNMDQNRQNLLAIFEKYNIENIEIDGEPLLSLFDDKVIDINNELYDDFIKPNKFAFDDFKKVFLDIIRMHGDVPFFPLSRFRKLNYQINKIVNWDKNKPNIDLAVEISFLLSRSQRLLNDSLHNLGVESDTQFAFDFALEVYSFLKRRFDDYMYENTKRINRRERFSKAYKASKLATLARSTRYISTVPTEIQDITDDITKKLANLKEKMGNEYVSYFQKHGDEKVDTSEIKDMLDNLNKANKIIKFYLRAELFFDENILLVKKEEKDLEINQLSSGEKRLLTLILASLFSSEKFILVDEPEISLSLNYQSKIMDDLLECIGDKKIVIATHAPFIYKACKRLGFELVEL